MQLSNLKRIVPLVLTGVLGSALTGCSSGTAYNKTALKYGMTNMQATVNRSDLVIGSRAESSASGTYILFGLLSFGNDPEATAYNNLLGQMPDADEVVGVSTKSVFQGLPPLFWTTTVTVYGKPVTIKSDMTPGR